MYICSFSVLMSVCTLLSFWSCTSPSFLSLIASSHQPGKYKLLSHIELTSVRGWYGEKERQGRHEIERLRYVDSICVAHVMPRTTLSLLHLHRKLDKMNSKKKKSVGHFLISTHLLNMANTEILPFHRSKMD